MYGVTLGKYLRSDIKCPVSNPIVVFCEGVKVPVGGEGYDSHISVSLPIKEDKLFVSSRRCAAARKNEFKRSLRLDMLGRSGGRSSGLWLVGRLFQGIPY